MLLDTIEDFLTELTHSKLLRRRTSASLEKC